MILVITLTMLIAYAITTLVVYRQTIHIMEGEVRQEADYINVALDTSGESYLKTMDNVHVDTRITLIDPDGKVKYDSKEDDVNPSESQEPAGSKSCAEKRKWSGYP